MDNNFYVVQHGDTIEKIAACVNVTPNRLKSLNKLIGNFLYAGQHLKLPSDAVLPLQVVQEKSNCGIKSEDEKMIDSNRSIPSDQKFRVDQDQQCPKFLKIKSKYITQFDGTVSGVLLVTPNSIMFDPDLMHPLIIENGPSSYTVTARMNSLVSVALFENLPVHSADELTDHITPDAKRSDSASPLSSHQLVIPETHVLSSTESSAEDNSTTTEECHSNGEDENFSKNRRKGRQSIGKDRKGGAMFNLGGNHSDDERQACDFNAFPADTVKDANQRHTPSNAFHMAAVRKVQFSLFECDDKRPEPGSSCNEIPVFDDASSFGSFTIGQCPSFGQMAGVSTSEDIQKSDFSEKISKISHEINAEPTVEQKSAPEDKKKALKRTETLEKLFEKTYELRLKAQFPWSLQNDSNGNEPLVQGDKESCGALTPELPYYLCVKVEKNQPQPPALQIHSPTPHHSETIKSPNLIFEEKLFFNSWFTVPKIHVVPLYNFLLHWLPEKFDEKHKKRRFSPSVDGEPDFQCDSANGDENLFGFVLLDRNDDLGAALAPDHASQLKLPVESWEGGAAPLTSPDSLNLNQQWEIVTVEEVKRRMSVLDLFQEPDFFTLPESSDRPLDLTDEMLDRLLRVLPARAQGYPWVLVYSTEAHGFSLNTLYRNMATLGDGTPVILLVTDFSGGIFGAVLNCPICLADVCYGSGESFLFSFCDGSDVNSTKKRRSEPNIFVSVTQSEQTLVTTAQRSVSISTYSQRTGSALGSQLFFPPFRSHAPFPSDGFVPCGARSEPPSSAMLASSSFGILPTADLLSQTAKTSETIPGGVQISLPIQFESVANALPEKNDQKTRLSKIDSHEKAPVVLVSRADSVAQRAADSCEDASSANALLSIVNDMARNCQQQVIDKHQNSSAGNLQSTAGGMRQHLTSGTQSGQLDQQAQSHASALQADVALPATSFQLYKWTGANNYVVHAQKRGLALGADAGRFGLFLDPDLNYGISQPCTTFGNVKSLSNAGENFGITRVEAFACFLNENY